MEGQRITVVGDELACQDLVVDLGQQGCFVVLDHVVHRMDKVDHRRVAGSRVGNVRDCDNCVDAGGIATADAGIARLAGDLECRGQAVGVCALDQAIKIPPGP